MYNVGIGRPVGQDSAGGETLVEEIKSKLFDALFENSELLVFGLDTEGRIIIFNPACERLSGYAKDEVLGLFMQDFLIPGRIKEDVHKVFKDFLAGKAPDSFVNPWLTRTGEERLVSWSTCAIADQQGRPSIALGLGVDITERVKAEDELLQKSQELEAIFQALPDLFFRLGPDGTYLDYRVGKAADLYVQPEEFMGKRVQDVLPPDVGQRFLQAIQEVNRSKSALSVEYTLPLPEGQQAFEARLMPAANQEVIIVVRNVTGRVEAERLARVQRDLAIRLAGTADLSEVLEASFKAILEVTGLDSGGIYLVDEETGGLDLAYHEGLSEAFVQAVSHYDAKAANVEVVNAGKPLYIIYRELEVPRADAEDKEGLKALAVVPVKGEGRVVGCINAASHAHDEIPQHARDAMEILAGQVGQAILRADLLSALRDSEERYRLLHDYAGEAIFTFDRDLRVISVNRMTCVGIGYSEEELLGRNILELGILKPEHIEKARRDIEAILRTKRVGRSEYEFVRKDGSALFVENTAAPLFDDKGELIAISNIALDITDRKRAEEILRSSEEEFRVTFESTGTAMTIIELDGTVSAANQGTERLFGYSREEIEGKIKYSKLIYEEDLEMVRRYAVNLLKGEIEGPIQYECRLVARDGRRIDALLNVAVLPGIGKSVVSAIDITEKKEYERMLEERAEQLRDFLDIAAHELRHPATLLKGYAMTLDKRGDAMDRKTWSESLRAIVTGSDRLVHVVEELLDVSRIERSRFTIQRERVQVEMLINRAAEEMRAKSSESDIRIELRGEIDKAYVDPERLVRLVVILLDNAIKYSSPGSMVEVVGEMDDGDVVISVLDRGIGIPDEDQERIFERFYQVEDVLHHGGPGLGLGLYIGARIVEAHGGKLWYEPREGGGSTFRFSIPLHESEV